MRRGHALSVALVAVTAVVATGCSLGASGSSPSPAGTAPAESAVSRPLATYIDHGVTFTYPLAWRHHGRGFYSNMTEPVIDLSNQPLGDPCRHRNRHTSCGIPLRRLRPGGVVVSWESGGGLIDPAHLPPPGVLVKVTRPGSCASVHGDETLFARVTTRNQRIFLVQACVRAPGVAAGERALRAMLASARAG